MSRHSRGAERAAAARVRAEGLRRLVDVHVVEDARVVDARRSAVTCRFVCGADLDAVTDVVVVERGIEREGLRRRERFVGRAGERARATVVGAGVGRRACVAAARSAGHDPLVEDLQIRELRADRTAASGRVVACVRVCTSSKTFLLRFERAGAWRSSPVRASIRRAEQGGFSGGSGTCARVTSLTGQGRPVVAMPHACALLDGRRRCRCYSRAAVSATNDRGAEAKEEGSLHGVGSGEDGGTCSRRGSTLAVGRDIACAARWRSAGAPVELAGPRPTRPSRCRPGSALVRSAM